MKSGNLFIAVLVMIFACSYQFLLTATLVERSFFFPLALVAAAVIAGVNVLSDILNEIKEANELKAQMLTKLNVLIEKK